MKSLFGYSVIALIALLIVGCTWDHLIPEEDPIEGPTGIRIRNASTYDFKDVYVNTSGGERNYSDINKGEVTGYKSFEYAYKYAYVTVMIDTSLYSFNAFCYTGEKTLGEGNFTYIVTVGDTVYKSLNIEVVED